MAAHSNRARNQTSKRRQQSATAKKKVTIARQVSWTTTQTTFQVVDGRLPLSSLLETSLEAHRYASTHSLIVHTLSFVAANPVSPNRVQPARRPPLPSQPLGASVQPKPGPSVAATTSRQSAPVLRCGLDHPRDQLSSVDELFGHAAAQRRDRMDFAIAAKQLMKLKTKTKSGQTPASFRRPSSGRQETTVGLTVLARLKRCACILRATLEHERRHPPPGATDNVDELCAHTSTPYVMLVVPDKRKGILPILRDTFQEQGWRLWPAELSDRGEGPKAEVPRQIANVGILGWNLFWCVKEYLRVGMVFCARFTSCRCSSLLGKQKGRELTSFRYLRCAPHAGLGAATLSNGQTLNGTSSCFGGSS